ncbi:unnamed protein product [Notodromas monacha]|uniref:DM domain-containing protein n=1 Tax=Notodromas monacha TaxID=399045 RepID=A0A7R9BT55_9CRUS|nr:unnamed protein product [Notodromas monacha]CAG0919649.1 unnamed protein product [Notodromas monacha]
MKVIRKLGENFVGRMMLSSPGSSGHDPATAAMCFKPPITGKMLPMDGHALHRYHAQLAQQSSSFFAAAAAAGMGLFPPRPTLLPSHLHAAAAFSPFGTPLLRPTPLPHPGLVPLSQHPSLQHNPHLGAAPPAPPPSSVPPQPAGQQLPLSQPPSQAPPPPPPTSQQPPPGFLSPTLHQQHFEPQPSSVRGGGGGGSSSSASTPSSSSAAAAGASRPSTSKSAEQHHLQQQQAAGGKSSGAPSRRTPQCSRCFNHGLNIEKKNHQPYCENRFCPCELCETTAERQDKMAAQISKRRSQKNAMSQGKQLDLSQPSTSKGLPQMDHSPAKRPRSLPEREKLLAQFMKFMGTHVDLSYFPLFVAVYNEIGNFKDFESELERAEREMGILESEAESCDIPLSVNTPIKPIATRATTLGVVKRHSEQSSKAGFYCLPFFTTVLRKKKRLSEPEQEKESVNRNPTGSSRRLGFWGTLRHVCVNFSGFRARVSVVQYPLEDATRHPDSCLGSRRTRC